MQRRVFELHACVGRGGFGEVYRATMRSPGGLVREVAVKMLKRDVAPDDDAVQRLRYEANLLARLDHRAILHVVDMVNLAGRVCMVTQYVDGDDLLRCLQGDDPISERGLVELCGEVAGALHATATALELVHRDIKPSNIRVTHDGTIKLLDFGIARSDKLERDGHTHAGVVVGTPGYMAPERFLDDDVTPASDIYALACVMFAGLTQQRLHQDLSRKRLMQLALDPSEHQFLVEQRMREVRDDGLRALLTSMLQHDPANRPRARRVEEACEDLAPRSAGKPLRRWARERAWPSVPEEHGDLVGQVLEEEPDVPGSASPARPGAPERARAGAPLSPVPAPQIGLPRAAQGGPPPGPSLGAGAAAGGAALRSTPTEAPRSPPVASAPRAEAAEARTVAAEPPRSAAAQQAPPFAPAGPSTSAPSAVHGVVHAAAGSGAGSTRPSPSAPGFGAAGLPAGTSSASGAGATGAAVPAPPAAPPPSSLTSRPTPPPASAGGRFVAPVIVLGMGTLMYSFLAMEGHVPPPQGLWRLAEAAMNDAQIAWKDRNRR